MRRSALLRRTRLRSRSTTPPTHRLALPPDEYVKFRAALLARWGWRCGICERVRPLDPHHIPKRSKGRDSADDFDHAIPVCRPCHDETDVEYSAPRGRLVIERLGGMRFRWARIKKPDKFAPDPPDVVWTTVESLR